MSDEELSLSEINALLTFKQTASDKEKERWPNPYKDIIRQAVESGQTFVSFGGERFKISTTGTKFHLRPATGFVPCGWFDYAWLKEN